MQKRDGQYTKRADIKLFADVEDIIMLNTRLV